MATYTEKYLVTDRSRKHLILRTNSEHEALRAQEVLGGEIINNTEEGVLPHG